MWKKIGSIGPASNDNKSSRSKDQNAQKPFSQMSKIRVSQSQLFFENNELFCPSYLGKKKGELSKCFSQSRIQIAQQLQPIRSTKQIPSQNKQSTIKKRTLDRDQVDELKLRISQKIIQGMDDSLQKQQKQFEQQNMPPTQSTQIICSETSLDEGVKKLKHVKSSPQFDFVQIGSIREEVSFDLKIETQKNLNSLKKEHTQIKKVLKNELNDFKNCMKSVETQLQNRISKIMQEGVHQQSMEARNNGHFTNLAKNRSLNFQQVSFQTKNFGDKFQHLNQKKKQMMNKLISLRSK